MHQEPLDVIPLWLLFVAVCAFTGLALEGGYRLGRWRHSRTEDEKPTPIGAMVGSILALFAFLLAFTFGMALTRFEARRQAVLDEANAIHTAYLRTSLLRDDKQRDESAALLREYVEVRLRGIQEGKTEEAIQRSRVIQDLLWMHATKAARNEPGPIVSLYVQSLNLMIEMHAKRVQFVRSRIPFSIWVGLFAIALLAMASVGYQAGLSPTRRSPAMIGLVVAFAGVLFLIADLDRPQQGFLTVSQQAMVELQKTMNEPTSFQPPDTTEMARRLP